MDINIILEFLKDNPILSSLSGILLSSGIIGYLGRKIYIFLLEKGKDYLINDLLNVENSNKIGDILDDKIDALQKRNPETGKETRDAIVESLENLIKTITNIINKLKEDDGVN